MRLKRIGTIGISLIALTVTLLFFFQNCSPVHFSAQPNETNLSSIDLNSTGQLPLAPLDQTTCNGKQPGQTWEAVNGAINSVDPKCATAFQTFERIVQYQCQASGSILELASRTGQLLSTTGSCSSANAPSPQPSPTAPSELRVCSSTLYPNGRIGGALVLEQSPVASISQCQSICQTIVAASWSYLASAQKCQCGADMSQPSSTPPATSSGNCVAVPKTNTKKSCNGTLDGTLVWTGTSPKVESLSCQANQTGNITRQYAQEKEVLCSDGTLKDTGRVRDGKLINTIDLCKSNLVQTPNPTPTPRPAVPAPSPQPNLNCGSVMNGATVAKQEGQLSETRACATGQTGSLVDTYSKQNIYLCQKGQLNLINSSKGSLQSSQNNCVAPQVCQATSVAWGGAGSNARPCSSSISNGLEGQSKQVGYDGYSLFGQAGFVCTSGQWSQQGQATCNVKTSCSAPAWICDWYKTNLARLPEAAGSHFWIATDNISGRQATLARMILAPEVAAVKANNGQPTSDPSNPVGGIYETTLNIPNVACDSIKGVNCQFETEKTVIEFSYITGLRRLPDPSGYQFWSGIFRTQGAKAVFDGVSSAAANGAK